MLTAEDIAKFYPHLDADAQQKAADVMNSFDPALKVVSDPANYPNETQRKNLVMSVAMLRQNAVAMLGQG